MSDDAPKEFTADQRIDLYKFYAAETEKIIERRAAASRYFLTINSALIAVLGSVKALVGDTSPDASLMVALAVAGASVCVLWFFLILSYSNLTRARFDALNELGAAYIASTYHTDEAKKLETGVPGSAMPYALEWMLVKKQGKYFSISAIERLVPITFIGLYIFLGSHF